MTKCEECEVECDHIDTLEEDEEKMCCRCGNLSYDEQCLECRQRTTEDMADDAMDRYKDEMMEGRLRD